MKDGSMKPRAVLKSFPRAAAHCSYHQGWVSIKKVHPCRRASQLAGTGYNEEATARPPGVPAGLSTTYLSWLMHLLTRKRIFFPSVLSNTASFSDSRQNRASSKLRKEMGIALPEFRRRREDVTELPDLKSGPPHRFLPKLSLLVEAQSIFGDKWNSKLTQI